MTPPPLRHANWVKYNLNLFCFCFVPPPSTFSQRKTSAQSSATNPDIIEYHRDNADKGVWLLHIIQFLMHKTLYVCSESFVLYHVKNMKWRTVHCHSFHFPFCYCNIMYLCQCHLHSNQAVNVNRKKNSFSIPPLCMRRNHSEWFLVLRKENVIGAIP